MDIWFYGMQVTLHEQPDQVLTGEKAGIRHFGVALSEEQFDALVDRWVAMRSSGCAPSPPITRGRPASRPRGRSRTRAATPSS